MDAKITDEEFPLKVAEPTAEWHLSDERERLALLPATTVWQRSLAWLFLATGFGFFVFVRGTAYDEVAYTVATSQGLLIIGISQAILVFLYRRQSNHVDVGTGFRRLRSKVPPEVDLPVNVEIVQEGSMTGRDRGYIWLDDGTWYFKGLQTAFRFNQHDVVPIEAWSRLITPDPAKDKPPRILPLKTKSGHVVLRIDVLDPYEDLAKRKRVKGFYREMYDWLYERPRGAIESLLPPTSVHPELACRGIGRFEGLVGAGVMVAIDSAVLAGLPRATTDTNLGNYGLLAAIGVTALLFFSVRFAWLETHDLLVRSRLCKKVR